MYNAKLYRYISSDLDREWSVALFNRVDRLYIRRIHALLFTVSQEMRREIARKVRRAGRLEHVGHRQEVN